MGQLFSSEEELSQLKDVIGSLIYNAMLEGGAVPNLEVVHPLLLADHDKNSDSRAHLQEQLKQVNKIPNNVRPMGVMKMTLHINVEDTKTYHKMSVDMSYGYKLPAIDFIFETIQT